MRKISLLKMLILLFLIPFCLYLLYKIHSAWTDRTSLDNPEITQEGKGIARVEQFEMKGLEMDGEAFTLKAQKFSQLEEGASLLEQIDPLILKTAQGTKIYLSGNRGIMIEGKGEHKKIMIEGNVTISTEDGHKLETEKLIYETSSKEAVSDGKVNFSGPGFHGSASQLHYSLNTEIAKLTPHFDLTLERESGALRIQAAYFEGSLDLKEGLLKGGVVLNDGEKEILAQEAKCIMDRESGQWKEIQLTGSVQGKIAQEEKDQKTRLSFLSHRATILFHEGEELEQIVMEDNISVIMENENDPSGNYKKLQCDKLSSYWNTGRIAQLNAEGNVRIEMLGKGIGESESPETLSCQALLINFSQNGSVHQALAYQDVSFQSGTTRGNCQEAEYNSKNKQITMRQKEHQPPHLSVDVWSVQAAEIIIKGREEMSASGDVKTLYREKSCQDCQIPLFQSGKSIFISSEALDIVKGEEALYSGHVRAWQEENSVEAQRIHIFFKANIFEAHGDVISRFARPPSQDAEKKEKHIGRSEETLPRIEVQSDHLLYSGEERKASYSGHVELQMKESKMSCSEMDVLFSEEGQAEKIEARSDIEIESKDFEAKGEHLEYLLSERAGKLYGTYTPARIYSKSEGEMAVGAFLTFHMLEDTISLFSRDEGRTWMIFK